MPRLCTLNKDFFQRQLFCLFLHCCSLLSAHKQNLHIVQCIIVPPTLLPPHFLTLFEFFLPSSLYKGSIYTLVSTFSSSFLSPTDDQLSRWCATHHDQASPQLSVPIFMSRQHLASVFNCYFSENLSPPASATPPTYCPLNSSGIPVVTLLKTMEPHSLFIVSPHMFYGFKCLLTHLHLSGCLLTILLPGF